MKTIPAGYHRFSVTEGRSCWSGFVRDGYDAGIAPCLALDAPETELCKDRPKVKAGLVGEVFVKRYNLPGVWNQLRRNFRTPRPLLALQGASAIEKLGIYTPAVLAAFTVRRGMVRRDYLLTARMPAGYEIGSVCFPVPGAIDGGWEILARRFLPLLVKMHDAGIEHGDLNLRNICCDADWKSFGVIDLDGCRICRGAVPFAVRIREAARVASSFLREFPSTPLDALAMNISYCYAELSNIHLPPELIAERMEYLLSGYGEFDA